MKRIFLATLLFFPLFLWGQTVTVSEEVTLRDDRFYDILSDERGNVLLFRDRSSKLEVQGYDQRMQKRWEKEIELDKKNAEVLEVVSLNGDFCVIYQFRHKGNLVLKAQRFSSSANLLDSVTIKNFESVFLAPDFKIELSENKKVALIWYEEQQYKITAFSFDIEHMKLLWEINLAPESVYLPRDFHQMLVDNEGNMYLVLLKDNISSRNKSHYLEVFDYGLTIGENLRRYIVSMQDHLTYDAFFAFDNLNKALKAGGLYSTNNPSRAEGFYFLSIPQKTPDAQLLRFHPFEGDFVNILLEKDKSKNKGIPEVSAQEIVLRRDGGIILAGELNKSLNRGGVPTGYNVRGGFRAIIDHYYDDVFLISLHPDGEIHWKDILHKKQYSQDDGAIYSSYFMVKTPTALRVIFNDEIKPESTVSEYVIRGNGGYDRKAVMNTERKDLMLRLRDAIQISANAIIIPSERRSRLKLVRVEY
jgi:hypothetical protein